METQTNKNDLMNVGTPKMEAMGFSSACHTSVFFCYNRMCKAKKRFISPGSGGLAVLGHSDIWQSGEGTASALNRRWRTGSGRREDKQMT